MTMPTLYQRVVIEAHGYDPEIWWPIEWGETSARIKSRETNEVATLDDIEGFCADNVCRNIAGDEDDPNHDYRQQVTINEGGPR